LPARLPDDYRAFLLEHNGGVPSKDEALTPSGESISLVDRLYGLHDGPYWASLEWARRTYDDRMPEDVLDIGSDPGGNAWCLKLTEPDKGSVWFWDHEEEVAEGDIAGYQNMTYIAPSFTAFLEGLIGNRR